MRPGKGALVVALAAACGCQHTPAVQPVPPRFEVVALLPDPETKTLGAATVSSTAGGSVELTGEQSATRVARGQPPSAPFVISDLEVQRLFGDALAARPPAARQFLLNFESGADHLTPESENLLTEMLALVKSRSVPDLTVVGHTDTTGSAEANIELGRSRATLIRDRLVAAGLDGRLISVVSHGEADLLVPTPDETAEPKNRRVEVSVR
jgi:outer membrane protein OmpA-like peptidoglycan-associated protein